MTTPEHESPERLVCPVCDVLAWERAKTALVAATGNCGCCDPAATESRPVRILAFDEAIRSTGVAWLVDGVVKKVALLTAKTAPEMRRQIHNTIMRSVAYQIVAFERIPYVNNRDVTARLNQILGAGLLSVELRDGANATTFVVDPNTVDKYCGLAWRGRKKVKGRSRRQDELVLFARLRDFAVPHDVASAIAIGYTVHLLHLETMREEDK